MSDRPVPDPADPGDGPVLAWTRDDGHVVSTDPARLDFDVIHPALAASYWSPGVERARVERAARHSIPFGLYAPDGAQRGYCRVISDRATFAYLADVIVVETARGRGLGRWLVSCTLAHPDLQDLRRWMLFTRDAHLLYARLGFGPLTNPARVMVRPGGAPSAF